MQYDLRHHSICWDLRGCEAWSRCTRDCRAHSFRLGTLGLKWPQWTLLGQLQHDVLFHHWNINVMKSQMQMEHFGVTYDFLGVHGHAGTELGWFLPCRRRNVGSWALCGYLRCRQGFQMSDDIKPVGVNTHPPNHGSVTKSGQEQWCYNDFPLPLPWNSGHSGHSFPNGFFEWYPLVGGSSNSPRPSPENLEISDFGGQGRYNWVWLEIRLTTWDVKTR